MTRASVSQVDTFDMTVKSSLRDNLIVTVVGVILTALVAGVPTAAWYVIHDDAKLSVIETDVKDTHADVKQEALDVQELKSDVKAMNERQGRIEDKLDHALQVK